MRVFLAGNLGYIGTTLTETLRKAGYSVVGCDCGYFRSSFIKGDPESFIRENVSRQLFKDTRDVAKGDLAGCDAVLDYSGLANDPASDLNPKWTEDINHAAPVRLARLAKECGIPRFIFSSSCSIYGAPGGDKSVSEESPLGPLTAYARAKVAVEKDVLPLKSRSFAPVMLRNATVFGVSYKMRFDLVVNNLTGWAYTTGKVKLLSAGTSWRPNLHVEDASNAVIAALEAPADAVAGEPFNVGMDSENYRVSEIAGIVRSVVPGCVLEAGKDAPVDPRSYRVSFAKIGKLKGFRPKWTVPMGVRQLHSFFIEIGLDLETFKSSRFYDVEAIKSLIAGHRVDADLRCVG